MFYHLSLLCCSSFASSFLLSLSLGILLVSTRSVRWHFVILFAPSSSWGYSCHHDALCHVAHLFKIHAMHTCRSHAIALSCWTKPFCRFTFHATPAIQLSGCCCCCAHTCMSHTCKLTSVASFIFTLALARVFVVLSRSCGSHTFAQCDPAQGLYSHTLSITTMSF